MYGAFHGGDPRDFTPDDDGTSDKERAAHVAACEAAERDEAARRLDDTHSWYRTEGGGAIHIARSGFGLGVTVFRDREAEALYTSILAHISAVTP